MNLAPPILGIGLRRAFVAGLLAVSASTSGWAQNPPYLLPSDSRYPAAKAHMIAIARAELKDADSARIGSVIICGWLPDTKVALVNVNARNSFGAYVGFKIGGVIDSNGTQGVIFINPRPSNAEESESQRALLDILDACKPALAAYKEGGFEK